MLDLGAEVMLHVDLPAFDGRTMIVRASAAAGLAPGAPLALLFDPAALHLFDASGERVRQARPASARGAPAFDRVAS